MAQVHGDPEEMRRFASTLHKFTEDLNASTRRVNGASRAVGSTWNDSEYRKFMREWQQTMRTLQRFLTEAPKYEKYVLNKAKALDNYLRRG